MNIMKNTIREELENYIAQCKEDGLTMHHEMFNDSYYIVGYYEASEWLKEHGLGELEAVGICNDFERDHFGEIHTTFDNPETLVNHLAYWYGLDLCCELNVEVS